MLELLKNILLFVKGSSLVARIAITIWKFQMRKSEKNLVLQIL